MTTGAGVASIRLDGYDRRVHARITGKGTPPQQPAASSVMMSPNGDKAFLELQGKHYLVTLPKAGKETVNVSLAAPTSNVPFKKMSNFGGDYLAWTQDGKNVTWSWGTKFYRQGVNDEKPEEFDLMMQVNVYGPYRVTQAFAPLIIASKGRIATVGSISGILAVPTLSAYAMTKHAIATGIGCLILRRRFWIWSRSLPQMYSIAMKCPPSCFPSSKI
jgi:hypothetical protein